MYFPFLAEAPEFAINVLEALRQPLESGHVVVSRAAHTAAFPARFQLILAANPCPCGNAGSTGERCECTPLIQRRYLDRISGPIRDRIDIHRRLEAPARIDLVSAGGPSTGRLKTLVAQARERQSVRYGDTPWSVTSDVPGVELRKRWPIGHEARALIDTQVRRGHLSARAADRVIRLAWTVADVCGHDAPEVGDVESALALRRGTGVGGPIRSVVTAS